jgi:hypothetical protein
MQGLKRSSISGSGTIMARIKDYPRKSAFICGSSVSFLRFHSRSPFVCIRGNHLRLRNVNELINCSLDPEALFRLRIAIPEGLLLAHENAVGAALGRHCANLRPGVTRHGFQPILNRHHSKPSERRLRGGS